MTASAAIHVCASSVMDRRTSFAMTAQDMDRHGQQPLDDEPAPVIASAARQSMACASSAMDRHTSFAMTNQGLFMERNGATRQSQ